MLNRNVMAMVILAGAIALVMPSQLSAQNQTPGLNLTRASPQAKIAQRVGVTDIEIVYHRPGVNEREIWGTVVPYGQVWRTGANENTLITFGTDVTVEGQALAAGTYGLHTLPGEEEWQIIFSNDTTAWGSFSYDESRDALRVTVKPENGPHEERMSFTFDDPSNDSTTVSIRWVDLRVPFKVAVDTKAQTYAAIQDQLKGLAQFSWQGWDQAANWALQVEDHYEEALGWTDRSIQIEERFDNLFSKAQLLEKTGETDQVAEIMDKALAMANAGQLHNYARQLMGQEKMDEALEVFARNVKQNPDAWFVELGLARGYSALGDFDKAVANMEIALGKAPEAQKAYVQSLVERLKNKEDIN
jgi:hypothetical protein